MWLRALILLAALLWPATIDPGWAAYYPGGPTCTSTKNISQTTSTDLVTFTNNIYVCSLLLTTTTAQSISLEQGTGTTCATGTVHLIGSSASTTTPTMPIGATGGFSYEPATPLKGTATGQHLCLYQTSTSGNTVAGVLQYSDAP